MRGDEFYRVFGVKIKENETLRDAVKEEERPTFNHIASADSLVLWNKPVLFNKFLKENVEALNLVNDELQTQPFIEFHHSSGHHDHCQAMHQDINKIGSVNSFLTVGFTSSKLQLKVVNYTFMQSLYFYGNISYDLAWRQDASLFPLIHNMDTGPY